MTKSLLTEIIQIGETEAGTTVNVYMSWKGHQVVEISNAWTNISLEVSDAESTIPLIQKAIEFWEQNAGDAPDSAKEHSST